MEVPEVKRLKSLEKENARLKKLLAEAMLDKAALQVALGRKYSRQTRSGKQWKSCPRLRVCRNVVPTGWQVCSAIIRLRVRLLTRCCLYASQSWRLNAALLVWQLLRREGLRVNHNRVYRIYQLNGLIVKRRRCRKGLATERLPRACT